jgi:hypothetical protein
MCGSMACFVRPGGVPNRLILLPPPLSKQVLSFYKIFGYPTGLGALLLRREAMLSLRPRYFGGGTVEVSVADADFVRQVALKGAGSKV